MSSSNNATGSYRDDRDRESRMDPPASASQPAIWPNDDGGLDDDDMEEEEEEGEALLTSTDDANSTSLRRDAGKPAWQHKSGTWAYLVNLMRSHRLVVAGVLAVGVVAALLFVTSGSRGDSGDSSPKSHDGGGSGSSNSAHGALVTLKSDFDAARRAMDDALRQDYGIYYDAMFTRTIDVVSEESDIEKDQDGDGSNSNSNNRLLRRVEDAQVDGGDENGAAPPEPKQPQQPQQPQPQTKVVSVGRLILQSPTFQDQLGPKRMRRRMMRKLLQVLLNRSQQQQQQQQSTVDSNININNVTFVWATGGHSSSAGHGNLYNESYTPTLDRRARDVFGAVGISFEGRNRAMGGTNSFPEIALCHQEVFGLDIDVLSWDYGMVRAVRARETTVRRALFSRCVLDALILSFTFLVCCRRTGTTRSGCSSTSTGPCCTRTVPPAWGSPERGTTRRGTTAGPARRWWR
jgi:hypothetical protein